MYGAVQEFPLGAKMPAYGSVTLVGGTWTALGQATFTLVDNAGNAVGTQGNADNESGLTTATITVDKAFDAAALSFTPGCYLCTFHIPCTGSDGRARVEIVTVILYVPGRVVNRTQWPTEMDLQVRLVQAGLLDNPATQAQRDTIDLAQALDRAVDWWERETGFKPFLAETIDSTLYYNSENGVTDLQGGYVSITSLSVNTQGKVSNQDYRAFPVNAPQRQEPFTYLNWGYVNGIFPQFSGTFPIFTGIEFPQPGQAGAVAVTGKRGYAQFLPEAAFRSVLDIAGVDLIPTLEPLKLGAIISKREGDTQYDYRTRATNKSVFSVTAEEWRCRAMATAQNHFLRVRMA